MREGVRAAVVTALCLASAGAWAATYSVTTAADDGPGSLRQALVAVAAGGASANDEVVLQAGLGTIVLASDLPAISAASLIVRGNGAVVSGSGQYRGLAALGSGSLRIEDLAFTNTAAIGGDGGAGGGGGMGAGGAIFVGTFPSASNVTLVGVAASSSQARGGNGGLISVSDPVNNVGLASGGGGGMGGGGGDGALNGTRAGGGGGFGRFAFGGISSDGQSGIARAFGRAGSGTATSGFRGGFFGGGGGGGDSPTSSNPASGGGGGVNAGDGGFFGGLGGYGGGGGGSGRCTGGPGGCGNSGPGGFGGGAGSTTSANASSPNGGFGGGGGVGGLFGSSGFGGYGAGRASPGNAATRRGGGGLGAGGGAFVQQGSSLRFEGTFTWSAMSAAPGVSPFAGEARGLGAAIFLHGNDAANGGSGRLRFSPAAGATQTIFDSIDDQGSFGGGGAWTPLLDGDGTLELFGSNSVAGVEVTAGTLRPASDASLGRPNSPLRLGSASLHPLFPGFSSTRALQLSGLGRLDVDDSMTWSGVIGGAGTLVKRGAGTLLVDGVSASAGAAVVEQGVLRIDGVLQREVEVQDGATLAGSGTAGAVTALPSSRIEPGLDRATAATLTTGGLDLRAGSALALAVFADGSSDRVIAPQVTLGGTLSIDVDPGYANATAITLIDNAGGSAVLGTFDLLPEGATVSFGAQTRLISYRGGDGNDVVLVSASAPLISSASTAQWTIGTARAFDIVAEGQPAPTLSIAGTLPQGIAFSPQSGRLDGTAAAGTAGAYELTITASNGIGSDAVQVFTLNVVRAAQSITFDAPADRDFALAPFDLQGVASSGLDVEYASQTPATCFTDARSLAMFSAGTCTLTAGQPGDASFEPATPVQRSFQIVPVLPGAPRNGTAVKIDPVFALLFDPPESNGGIPIEGYRATCEPGALEFAGSDAPLELTGLVPGPTYLCVVQARNALGFGPASATIGVPTQDPIFGDGFE